jgi:hypothetical protein
VLESERFNDRGVAYRVLTTIFVRPAEPTQTAALTIEPGVTLRFINSRGAGRPGDLALRLGDRGRTPAEPLLTRLIADGTAERPIRLESADAVPRLAIGRACSTGRRRRAATSCGSSPSRTRAERAARRASAADRPTTTLRI